MAPGRRPYDLLLCGTGSRLLLRLQLVALLVARGIGRSVVPQHGLYRLDSAALFAVSEHFCFWLTWRDLVRILLLPGLPPREESILDFFDCLSRLLFRVLSWRLHIVHIRYCISLHRFQHFVVLVPNGVVIGQLRGTGLAGRNVLIPELVVGLQTGNTLVVALLEG